jgi:hypothetical protein
MLRAVKSVSKFLIVFLVMTVINAIVWAFVAGDLYDCTDGVLPGYFEPGDWVHPWGVHSVAVVSHVVHARSMSQPDTIKDGWTVARLLALWWVFFGVSVVVSLVLACLKWVPLGRPNESLNSTAAALTRAASSTSGRAKKQILISSAGLYDLINDPGCERPQNNPCPPHPKPL